MPAGDILFQRLRSATDAELKAIAAHLDETKALTSDRELDTVHLSKKYRAAAGSSLVNLFRGDHALPYSAILRDCAPAAAAAAGWEKANVKDAAEDVWIEEYVLQAISFAVLPDKERLSPAEKAQARESAEKALAGQIASRGTILDPVVGLGALGGGVVGAMLGVGVLPLMVAAGAMSLLISAAGPAMRKVLPATMVLIQVRKRQEFEELLAPSMQRAS
jgi:hypothetical protein